MTSLIYRHRPYLGTADLASMLNLVSMRPPERLAVYPDSLDLQEITGTQKGRDSFRLWEDADGNLVGFTLLEGSSIAFDISPRIPFDDLAKQMVDWAGEQFASAEVSQALSTGCREEDNRRFSFLERHGFVAQPVRTLHFIRGLGDDIPAPRLPDGFFIRPILGEEETESWVALHCAAHGTGSMSLGFRLSMMRTPDYDRALDLVAVAPDGRLAAYVMCHFSPEMNRLTNQKVGYTDPVATHPDFQRRGLSKALLWAGFNELKGRGLEYAKVSTWGENIAMIRTAESVGYRRFSSTTFFRRLLN